MELNKIQNLYIDIALEEAIKSQLRCKHGCIIVKNGKIIGKGHNAFRGYDKYGVKLKNNRQTIHAESAAINDVKDRNKLKDADLYVVRYSVKTGNALYSEPCHNCKRLIMYYMNNYGLRKAYYSIDMDITI